MTHDIIIFLVDESVVIHHKVLFLSAKIHKMK